MASGDPIRPRSLKAALSHVEGRLPARRSSLRDSESGGERPGVSGDELADDVGEGLGPRDRAEMAGSLEHDGVRVRMRLT